MEQINEQVTIKHRNKKPNMVYKVIKPFVYVTPKGELETIEPGRVFVGMYQWQIETGMRHSAIAPYVNGGFIEKIQLRDYIESQNK